MTMKPPLAKLLPELQRESRAYLEQFAEVELNPALLRVKIFDAAKLGHTTLRVPIPVHLNLQKTRAAERLETWCRESGLTLEWQKRSGDADGRQFETLEPLISWL